MTDLERGWSAGILDGEGSITIAPVHSTKRAKTYYMLRLTVPNTDPRVAQRLRGFFGGCISMPRPRATHHRQQYTWSADGKRAAEVLSTLRDGLVIKGEAADVALEFAATIGISTKRLDDATTARRIDLKTRLQNVVALRPAQ